MFKKIVVFLIIFSLTFPFSVSFASPTPLVISEGVLSYIAYLAQLAGLKVFDEYSNRSMLEDVVSYLSVEQYADIDRYYKENAEIRDGSVFIEPNRSHIKGFLDINNAIFDANSAVAQMVLPQVVDTVYNNVSASYDFFCSALDVADGVTSDFISTAIGVGGKLIEGVLYFPTDSPFDLFNRWHGNSAIDGREVVVPLFDNVFPSLSGNTLQFSRKITSSVLVRRPFSGNVRNVDTKFLIENSFFDSSGVLLFTDHSYYIYSKLLKRWRTLTPSTSNGLPCVTVNNFIRTLEYSNGFPQGYKRELQIEYFIYAFKNAAARDAFLATETLSFSSDTADIFLSCVALANERILYHDEVINKAMEREWNFPVVPAYFPTVKNPALDWVLENDWDAGVVINPTLEQMLADASTISVPIARDTYSHLLERDIHEPDVINWGSASHLGVNSNASAWTQTGSTTGSTTGVSFWDKVIPKVDALATVATGFISSTYSDFKSPHISILDKFPFCLPRDLYSLFTLFVSTPKTPFFSVDINGYIVNIDFAVFEPFVLVVRSFILCFVVYKLILLTKGVLQ